jgi:hypothetical protein
LQEGDIGNAVVSGASLLPFGDGAKLLRKVIKGTRLSKVVGASARLLTWAGNGWKSKAGLFYGLGSSHGNRVKHVLAHTLPDLSKPAHTVFREKGAKALELVDEAFTLKNQLNISPVEGDPSAFLVPMGRVVGTQGETSIRLVIANGNEIITAYPQ